jgi:endonuclease YncB( thermonuclease family)
VRSALWRRLADALVLIIVLALVVLALKRSDLLELGSGGYEVIDGDSLRRGAIEIRLAGIDAPEYRQSCSDTDGRDYACGKEAAAALRSLVDAKSVTCSSLETDRYGRSVARCNSGELIINGEMVRLGWAIAYRGIEYRNEERDARAAGRGLWQGQFETPQAWRERDRLVRGDIAGIPAAED